MSSKIIAFLSAWLCFALNFAAAQTTPGKIAGRVNEPTGEPAIAATVKLLKQQGSTAAASMQTDINGRFVFNDVKPGDFVVEVTAVGYATYRSALIRITTSSGVANLPVITLQKSDVKLDEVNITAERDVIEQKVDRTVVNIGSSISSTGASALEVLEKMPGVLIDQSGNITFKGKTGIMVMIDDKPTYLSGDNLANYLRSIPASQLAQIELMPNPPARYDAAGNAGIINIKTKKSNKVGFNGTINASAGKAAYPFTNESLSLNYRKGKFNFFANAAFNLQNYYRRLDLNRRYFDNAGAQTGSYTEEAYFRSKSKNGNVKLGLDYDLSAKTTLGIVLSGNLTIGRTPNPVTSILRNAAGNVDSTIIADNNTWNNNKNGGINFNVLHRFDSLGRSLSIDLNYLGYNNRSRQIFQNTSFDKFGVPSAGQHIIDTLPTRINIYTAKVDYSHPLKNKAIFSAGVKTSYVNTDNAARYYNISNSGAQTVDIGRTNQFLYKEAIQAAYLNFNKEWSRLSFQTGLRMEYTDARGHQLAKTKGADSSFVNKYLSLFPTVYLQYKLDTTGKHAINASFGRRIDRPGYQDLNPFVVVLDKYSAFVGNPFLRPQYSNNYALNYTYKKLLTVGLLYAITSNFQVEHDYQDGDIFYASSINLGKTISKGINANLTWSPAKWWNFSLYAQLYRNSYEGQLKNSYLTSARTFFYSTTTSQFTFGKGWSGELTAFYQTRNVWGQFASLERKQVNIGLQKKILNNKGAIKLSARDIFRSNFSAGEITNLGNMKATYRNDNANRNVVIGFSYNFGSKPATQRTRETGAETEAGRAKN
ncbi:outer membrane beta-barrel family protein [Mucilaginibacter auburnensis]|uniref:Outer membrane receptor protein involved in Fe transport n=1 Tax=Mucilaginibacter auburnensis TaxID=1457233 RepID=A0A2H9VTP1_9SPHI|nr:outer membrane beta-barrel family protein [Mucilaginibacter auburnensis]PJJ84197.1 outer membrane receptor protein involved in Fe transport [Mucilaginibacter auburnensis]